MTTRVGKIARLPLAIREELCQRLLNGEGAPKILPWLNGLPEVQKILGEDFEGLAVNDENLSAWRKGGYQEWLTRHDRTQRTKELAAYASRLAKADGGDIAEGASAIVGGRIMEILEACDGKVDPEQIGELIKGLTSLRMAQVAEQRADVDRDRLKLGTEALALERQKFQRSDMERFVKWHKDERAKNILNGDDSNDSKTERLGELIFGADWK